MQSLEEAKRVLEIESRSILEVKEKLNEDFTKAVDAIESCKGKLIVAGIGKSGHIARKIASTFSSTGTPALFLHPAESSHGDLGVISKDDCILAISNGGESPELKDLLNFIERKGLFLIAMTGKKQSTLGKAGEVIIDCSISEEACSLKLAPTSSSTASLALGDALAMAVLKKKGFKEENFAEFHPGGSLGKKLLTRVRDVMHTGEAIPLVAESAIVKDILSAMTGREVRGVVGVVNKDDELVGIVTDGDIRRHLNKSKTPLETPVKEMMGTAPKTIFAEELAAKALFVMEQFSIQLLFVVAKDSGKKPVGILHLQDLLKAQIR